MGTNTQNGSGRMNVKELIKKLESLSEDSKDLEVKISVFYDNCEHIQDLSIEHYSVDAKWIVLRGEKKE